MPDGQIRAALEREVGGGLAEHRGELEAVGGEADQDGDGRRRAQRLDHEVVIGRELLQADRRSLGLGVQVGHARLDEPGNRRVVGGPGCAIDGVRVDLQLDGFEDSDLDGAAVEAREAVGEVRARLQAVPDEDRRPLRAVQLRLRGSKPRLGLSLDAERHAQVGKLELGVPDPGRHHGSPGRPATVTRGHRDPTVHRLDCGDLDVEIGFGAQVLSPVQCGGDTGLRQQVAGIRLQHSHLVGPQRVLWEAAPHLLRVQHLVLDSVLAGAEQGAIELGRAGRPHVQAAGHHQQPLPGLLLEVAPELEGAPGQGHVFGGFVVGGSDDPGAAMVRAQRVGRREAVEADRLDAAAGQAPERHRAHGAQPDHQDLGVHYLLRTCWAARSPLRTAPSMLACQV